MSSSVFSEAPSTRPNGADGDSNLVVVYSKNGISFDERAIENIMEEKSIASISVVRLTSPTPSMMEQEETERLEELERFLEANSDRDDSDAELRDTENESQSGGEELISEKDHVTGDDNENNSGAENNDDSTEAEEAEAPKVKKRPGRKPKPKKQKKRRKPKERPQIVGLSVEQFYAEGSADMVVKNALKLAGLSLFKRTPETDALIEIIKNDHNYTPFTSPEQMKAKKAAEKVALERQTAQGRKFIVQTQPNIKVLSAKKRIQVLPFNQVTKPQATQLAPRQLQPVARPQLVRPVQASLPIAKPQQIIVAGPRPVRSNVKVISIATEDLIEDDDDANNSSATADEENGDTEELSEPSDDSRETDNDRDSDIDFKMNNSRNSNANKRKRIKKLCKRPNTQQPPRNQTVHVVRVPPATTATTPTQFPSFKRRKEPQTESHLGVPAIGQIVQLNAKAAPTSVIALGSIPSTSFLKVRPTHKSLPIKAKVQAIEATRLTASPVATKLRRPPMSKVAAGFATPPQDVKEIIISKNLSSPKGVFTNLNSLLGDSNNSTHLTASSDAPKQRLLATPITPKTSLNMALASPSSSSSSVAAPSKGFMPIGVETASTHKLPAQIVIETHQSSSELAAENDKQLDLINSIVQDELRKVSLVEQPPASADETIPNLVKMLESSAAGLDPVGEANAVPIVDVVNVASIPNQSHNSNNFNANIATVATAVSGNVNDVENIDIGSARLLDTPDEDEITADFLQHVVGLIEEDKQFEAEVVKQVLASTESGGLDAIANAVVAPPIFETVSQLTTIAQPNEYQPPIIVSNSLSNLPIACSTPSRSSSSTTATTMSTLLQSPDVKVVRGNGRVIYLPPIEAPTTRAKRRAQNPAASTTTSSDISNISHCEPMLDSSQLANSSLDSDSFMSQASRGVHKKQLSKESSGGSVKRPKRSNKLNTSQTNDADASESQEDDDDPNKLWCICRQPHNNRFMICCDLCEDWYHGTCVNVTKAMGLEMEQNGVDWKCPKCVKRQEEKSQPRITDMLLPKHSGDLTESAALPKQPNETKPTTEAKDFAVPHITGTPILMAKQAKAPQITKPQPKVLHQQQLHFIKLGSGGSNASTSSDQGCVFCKRPARPNSVYCSDECIRKYAQAAIQTQQTDPVLPMSPQLQQPNPLDVKKSKKKDLFEDALRQADAVSKVERINVFERRSGRAITGHMAPSAQHLKKWLQDNPTFEVMQPGNLQPTEIERRQDKRISEQSSAESTPTKTTPATPAQKPVESQNKSIQLLSIPPSSAKKQKPTTSTSKLRSSEKSNSEKSVGKSHAEPVRLNVRQTFKMLMLDRIKYEQANALPNDKSEWLTLAEVDNFVKNMESELYHTFGRDAGAKYKSKYRTLSFNIRDRKNKTLFEKICAKQLEPKQLVRMTAAELASQELAKWREEENRHQLEIIKKSELDLLSRAQNYLVKTHKGEEVINTPVDVTLPDEELAEQSADKEMQIDSSDSKRSSHSTDPSLIATDTSSKELELERSAGKEKNAKSKEKERSADKDRERDKRHKNHKNHHHSTSKRSRSRSSSRSRSMEKRSHKRHHHDSDADKEKEASSSRDKQANKVRAEKEKVVLANKPAEKKTEPPLVFNLIDQILESEKTVEQAANLKVPTKQTLKTVPVATKTAPKSDERPVSLDKYGRYLHSLSSPPIWSGNVHMVDVTAFDVVIHPVHGDTSQLAKLLPTNLDVIGRITRVNVWDYLKKIKKSPTKEIVIVNLFPASASNTINFDSFYEYLDTRQRLGVLGADAEQIRDFYIFPLGSRDKLPSVLQTTETVPFYEDTRRPNTLLGIIVRCLSKKLATMSQTLPLPSLPTASNKTAKVINKTRAKTTFTPPSSPKRKRSTHSTSSKDDEFDIDAIIKAPIAKLHKTNISIDSTSSDDPNAPYSPGGSSDDNDDLAASNPINKDELERKVNEINKQIAAQRKEIAGLLNVESPVLTQPSPLSNAIANISSIPNLNNILASLKNKTETIAKASAGDDEEYNPEDAIASNSSYGMGTRIPENATRTKSRLAQLSEAELLSMVPDNLVDDLAPSTRHNEEPPPPGV
ncbi:uncharacterized protein LOC117576007 isoform X2 [Drosophila albomicans]|uniref:Uncharacterized protein LOC117576007 isoform X2 n=1 Tax=Drosophila albomicans TaxID=7291 RepID=A0A6P8XT88_DROAB|nr:uncharacterized protein LOC117576007 isoform X2 [Drosophila albomicans]